MKNILFVLFLSVVCTCMASCYAFLQADKLVYAGTLAKQPKEIKLSVDSVYTDCHLE